jgi:hypothetical protein
MMAASPSASTGTPPSDSAPPAFRCHLCRCHAVQFSPGAASPLSYCSHRRTVAIGRRFVSWCCTLLTVVYHTAHLSAWHTTTARAWRAAFCAAPTGCSWSHTHSLTHYNMSFRSSNFQSEAHARTLMCSSTPFFVSAAAVAYRSRWHTTHMENGLPFHDMSSQLEPRVRTRPDSLLHELE